VKVSIEKKRYDTATATEIAKWYNGADYGGGHWVEETLYLSPRDAWFLHGEGGEGSLYRKLMHGGWVRGEEIRVLSPEQVIAWCEEHQKVSVLEDHFAEVIDDG